jgi:hypothetical protein
MMIASPLLPRSGAAAGFRACSPSRATSHAFTNAFWPVQPGHACLNASCTRSVRVDSSPSTGFAVDPIKERRAQSEETSTIPASLAGVAKKDARRPPPEAARAPTLRPSRQCHAPSHADSATLPPMQKSCMGGSVADVMSSARLRASAAEVSPRYEVLSTHAADRGASNGAEARSEQCKIPR